MVIYEHSRHIVNLPTAFVQHITGLINTVDALTLPPSHIWSEFWLNPKGGPVRVSVGPKFVTHRGEVRGGGCQGGPRNRKTAQITRHPSKIKYYRCGCRETFFSSPGLPETTLFCRLTYSFYQIKRQGKYILTLYIRKVSQKGRFRSLLKYHISSKVPPSFSKFPQASHLRTLAKNLFSPHSFLAPLRQVCALLKISCQYAPVRPPTRFECF